MGRIVATAAGVLVLALLAAGLTETTLAVGERGRTSDDATMQVKPRRSATPKPAPSPSKSPVASATPLATPVATPASTPAGPTATTNSFVHMRAAATTSSAILFNLDGGTVVKLLPWSDSTWQEVQYNGTTGYIYRTYLAY